MTGPWKQLADDLALSDMTPKATYQPSDEINQAIKGATLAWATAKDEKEGTETPAGGDDRSASREGDACYRRDARTAAKVVTTRAVTMVVATTRRGSWRNDPSKREQCRNTFEHCRA